MLRPTLLFLSLFLFTLLGSPDSAASGGWPHVGSDAGGRKYSLSSEITVENVHDLQVVWRYSTGDLERMRRSGDAYKFQTTPILFEDSLIFCTPYNDVIALDPATGAEKWRFDARLPDISPTGNGVNCRGVTVWVDDAVSPHDVCAARIFTGTNDARLISLDARTGRPCVGFGENGEIRIDSGQAPAFRGEFQITSPPVVVNGVLITGSAIGDNMRADAHKGTVRAFDARTGAAKWIFDPIPRHDDAFTRRNWRGGAGATGHANVWTYMSFDDALGLVYLPTSSPSPDHYGGLRPGDNRYANSIVALDADTGQVVWHFQTVHHDLWDYDLPAQPILADLKRDGETIPGLILATKTGDIFSFDRRDGTPFWPIEERAVPQGDTTGEWYAPTQPAPTKPRRLVNAQFSTDDVWGLTPVDRAACRRRLADLRNEGLFTPPSVEGAVHFPFSGGGVDWGGGAFDEKTQTLYVMTNNVAGIVRLVPRAKLAADRDPLAVFDDGVAPQEGTPFAVEKPLLMSPIGAPCSPPPWGRIHAIDMSAGEIKWERATGSLEDFVPFGDLILPKGSALMGGPIATAGGVVFAAGTMDNYLRAFDADSGAELWKGRLPAGGQATPMTYDRDGRQFVVIAAGGHSNMQTTPGDEIVAFALPRRGERKITRFEKIVSRPTVRYGAIVLLVLMMAFGLLSARTRSR